MSSEWLNALVAGECEYVAFRGGRVLDPFVPPAVLFPGAFNPLHDGHLEIARLAGRRLAREAAFEISLANVEKPLLSAAEVASRLRQFGRQHPVVVTRRATFVEKARLFPGATFLVGADTVVRIGDPAFYADAADRDASLAELTRLGCRFLVFGRQAGAAFLTLDHLKLPESLRGLCEGVGETDFRVDIASRDIRRSSGA